MICNWFQTYYRNGNRKNPYSWCHHFTLTTNLSEKYQKNSKTLKVITWNSLIYYLDNIPTGCQGIWNSTRKDALLCESGNDHLVNLYSRPLQMHKNFMQKDIISRAQCAMPEKANYIPTEAFEQFSRIMKNQKTSEVSV